jgi:hypothetical protein
VGQLSVIHHIVQKKNVKNYSPAHIPMLQICLISNIPAEKLERVDPAGKWK